MDSTIRSRNMTEPRTITARDGEAGTRGISGTMGGGPNPPPAQTPTSPSVTSSATVQTTGNSGNPYGITPNPSDAMRGQGLPGTESTTSTTTESDKSTEAYQNAKEPYDSIIKTEGNATKIDPAKWNKLAEEFPKMSSTEQTAVKQALNNLFPGDGGKKISGGGDQLVKAANDLKAGNKDAPKNALEEMKKNFSTANPNANKPALSSEAFRKVAKDFENVIASKGDATKINKDSWRKLAEAYPKMSKEDQLNVKQQLNDLFPGDASKKIQGGGDLLEKGPLKAGGTLSTLQQNFRQARN